MQGLLSNLEQLMFFSTAMGVRLVRCSLGLAPLVQDVSLAPALGLADLFVHVVIPVFLGVCTYLSAGHLVTGQACCSSGLGESSYY